MSLVCHKCDKQFILQPEYDAHPCNQATSSSSGQRAQSSQHNAVPDDPVAKAEREVETLKAEHEKLREQITACDRCKRGEVTVHDLEELVVYVDDITDASRTTPDGKQKIDAKIVKLEDELKQKGAELLIVREDLKNVMAMALLELQLQHDRIRIDSTVCALASPSKTIPARQAQDERRTTSDERNHAIFFLEWLDAMDGIVV